jgi:hypothetical protein
MGFQWATSGTHLQTAGRGTVRTNSAKREGRLRAAPHFAATCCKRLGNADFARPPETHIAEAGETKQHHRPGRRLGDGGPRD